MKIKFIIISILILIVSGCRVYSWMVLENPEFHDDMLPTSLNEDLLRKYTVGNVIVHPRILYTDGAQTVQTVFVMFFSRENTPEVSIDSLKLSVNGTEIKYGKNSDSRSASEWKLYPANKPFYICSIKGEPIDLPKDELLKYPIDISLKVSVKGESETIAEKVIDAYFLPKKRSYME